MGKIIISLILAVIVVRIGRSLRMKLTGASMVVVNSRANMGLILVVAFFSMRQSRGKELSTKK